MVNIEDFIKRLEIILEYYSLNASSFADKIGVQRSSLSHLLSGRNKPSLDFILKILDVFPDVDLYWILNGKGNFPKGAENQQIDYSTNKVKADFTPTSDIEKVPSDLFSEDKIQNPSFKPLAQKTEDQSTIIDSENETIDKIVIFYVNGTFKSYRPN